MRCHSVARGTTSGKMLKMTKRTILILAIAGVVISSDAQSPPPPTPTVQAQSEQNLSESKQGNGTTGPKSIVSATAHDISAEYQSAENHQRATNRRIEILAWVVAIAAVAQFIAAMIQARHMRRGLSVAIETGYATQQNTLIAKKAVEQAEHTTLMTERAVVLIESVVAQPQTGPDADYFDLRSVLVFLLRNYGQTVANKVQLKGTYQWARGSENLRDMPETTMAPQGSNEWITSSFRQRMTADDIDRINKTENALSYHSLIASELEPAEH